MITVIGQFFGTSGYAKHTRYLANALNKIEDVSLQTPVQPGFELEVNDKELEMLKRPTDYKTNLVITHPVFWKTNLMAKKNIVYLVWEGDRVPRYMIDNSLDRRINKIIVPSHHTYDAVINSCTQDEVPLLMDKLIVVPHGVDLEMFYPIPKLRDASNKPSEPFRIMANKGLTNLEDRGGVQYLVKAYIEEFMPDENVELILKINPAYGIPNLLEMFPELVGETPRININTQALSTEDLNKLYNVCDIFVSPTRSEAFNIPCLEAMACGKSVLSTTFGGQTDFIKENYNGWLIDGVKTEVKHDLQYEGIKWLTPDLETLKRALRMAYNERHSSDLMENCLKTAQSYTWDNTAKKIHSLI